MKKNFRAGREARISLEKAGNFLGILENEYIQLLKYCPPSDHFPAKKVPENLLVAIHVKLN